MRAREKGRDGPPVILVALTGWGSDDDKARAQEAGFDLHLTKPVDAHEVEVLLNGLFRTGPAGKSIRRLDATGRSSPEARSFAECQVRGFR